MEHGQGLREQPLEPNYLDKIKNGREDRARKLERDQRTKQVIDAVTKTGEQTQAALSEVAKTIKTTVPKVEIEHKTDFQPLLKALRAVEKAVNKVPPSITIPKPEKIDSVSVKNLHDYAPLLRELISKVESLELTPEISVATPDVQINLSEVVDKLDEVVKQLKKPVVKTKTKDPQVNIDLSSLEAAMFGVKQSIDSIQFPIPNYVLPYKDPTTGKATQVLLTSDGKIPVDATVNVGAIGVIEDIQDGAGDSIMDAANNAMQVSIVAGSASGTQYTEDVAAAADPIGTALNLIRKDTLAAITSNDGDNVAARGTNKGELYVKHVDTITVDGSGVTQPVSNAGLTELAAAINSSKLDVNIASSDVASGGTSAADDADFTAGTTAGTPAMGVYESTPTSVTDGDLGTVGITSGRRLKTSSTIDAALPAGTNNIGDVDVLSSALPTGASTSAKQDTIIGHLDGVEGLLTTIDTDTGNISTKIDTLAGAVSGTEMQVDVLTMPSVAVTNAGLTELAGAINASAQMDVNIAASGVTVPISNAALTELAAAINSDKVDVNIASGNITGFATSAKQDTAQTALDAIKTSVETLDNAISGSEMQVDVVAALPAGTNAIGKLTQPATPTLTNVTMTGSSVTLQASNTARRNLMIFNDSGVTVYVKLGSSASSTSFTIKMADQSYYELPDPVYTGIVTALGASGDVRVTEVV